MVQLGAADWARVVALDPLPDAGLVEGVATGQLATLLAILALVEADVAISLFRRILLRQAFDEIFRAALGRCSLSLASHSTEEAIKHLVEHRGWVRLLSAWGARGALLAELKGAAEESIHHA